MGKWHLLSRVQNNKDLEIFFEYVEYIVFVSETQLKPKYNRVESLKNELKTLKNILKKN